MDFNRLETIIEDCFKRSTIKLPYLMESNDTDAMRKAYSKYKSAIEETDTLSQYETLEESDFENTDLMSIQNVISRQICMNKPSAVGQYLDLDGVEIVLSNARKRLISTYEELNVYVRVFAGIPAIHDTEEVFVDQKYADYCDVTKPVHKMSDNELEALYVAGVLTDLVKKYPNKTYLSYLHRRGTIMEIRDSDDFVLIKNGNSPGEDEINSKFAEYWDANRKGFLNIHHNIFLQRTTEYYESFVCMLLAWSVRMDLIRDSGFSLDRDYYDDHELTAIFNDYGITLEGLTPEIKRDLAMNISLLVRNRGTNKVLENLSDIFNIKNIYNYVIQKLYINGEPVIRCHAIPVKDMKNIRKYLTREFGYISYDKLISGDDTFSDKHLSNKTTRNLETIDTNNGYVNTYEALLKKDFSYIHSKYVSVDNYIDMSQTSLDFSLFYSYLLNVDSGIQNLKMKHKLGNFEISLVEGYAYLCTLLSWKYHFVDNVPSDTATMKYVDGLNHTLNLNAVKVMKTDTDMNANPDDFDIEDLMRVFEANFSGTSYMYLLKEWMVYNPGGSIYEFIDTYSTDRRLINVLRDIMKDTYDNSQYKICNKIIEYATRLNAKNTVFGTASTYSEYISGVNPAAYNRLRELKTTKEDVWSETFSDEITYVLKLFRTLIESLGNEEYVDSVSFLDDIRDTQINEIKNVLSYLVEYFMSMTTTVRDSEFVYDIGDEYDTYRPTEELHRQLSTKYLNGFRNTHDELEIKRYKDIGYTDMVIRDALFVKLGKRLIKIGGDHETDNFNR